MENNKKYACGVFIEGKIMKIGMKIQMLTETLI